MKKYDDISIYSMHTAAVGVLSKIEQSGCIRFITLDSNTWDTYRRSSFGFRRFDIPTHVLSLYLISSVVNYFAGIALRAECILIRQISPCAKQMKFARFQVETVIIAGRAFSCCNESFMLQVKIEKFKCSSSSYETSTKW